MAFILLNKRKLMLTLVHNNKKTGFNMSDKSNLPAKKKRKTPTQKRNKKTHVDRSVKVGMMEVTDHQTGEIKRVPRFEVKSVDFNFNKIWLGHLLDAMEVIGNKKIQIMSWLLENRNEKDNHIYATHRMIAEETKSSLPTVTETLTIMQEQNVLVKHRNGVYQLNPDLVFMGENEDRMDIMMSYKKTKTYDESGNLLENKRKEEQQQLDLGDNKND